MPVLSVRKGRMTASQLAQTLHARRTGKGKWTAKCPGHPDSNPSLAISEGRKGVVIRCMSNGCDTRDILDAMGLTFSDLFRDAASPQVRARTSLHELRDNTERRLGLVMWLAALDSDWAMIQKRIERELAIIRCKFEPAKIYQEYREREFQARLKRLGWRKLWEEVPRG